MTETTDATNGYEYQSTFDSLGGMEWELQVHDKKQREKDYCEHCSRSVGDDPKFFGVGGVLTGPFCSSSCAWGWLDE